MKTFNFSISGIRPWLLAGIAILVSATSCENFVDIPGPASQLPSNVVFEDVATADAALAHIYSSLQSRTLVTGEGNGTGILLGAYSDELVSYSNFGLPEETFFTNNLQANDAAVASLWSESYSLIYAANAILEGAEASQTLQQGEKNRIKGEALFLRSYMYSFLVQLFNEIPYVITTDYTINRTLEKSPVQTVYNLLMHDLAAAEGLLPDGYTGSGRTRPNKFAAAALAARVSLNAGEYAIAADKASEVINNTALYNISQDLDNVFLIAGPGTIWHLMPSAGGLNTLEGQNYILDSAPPSTRSLSESLVGAFEPGDLRKEHWIGTVAENGEVYYFPFKYKQSGPTGASIEYSVQLRIEEMFLVRAEARARTGDFIGAREDIDLIRFRAGLAATAADDEPGLLDAILQERRVEFFTELGHRFFDLKRFGRADAVLSAVKPGWNGSDIDLPLPDRELRLNPNLLPQNTGY